MGASAVEADLSRYHGLDLLDYWRGRLSFRQLLVRVRHLPPESATRTWRRDGRPEWTHTDDILDSIRMNFLSAHGVEEQVAHPISPAGQRQAQDAAEAQARREQRAEEARAKRAEDERVADLERRMNEQEVA